LVKGELINRDMEVNTHLWSVENRAKALVEWSNWKGSLEKI
jgi:hypothetical protein